MGEITTGPALGPQYTAPAPLASSHDVSNFNCGKAPLNDWLQTHALKQQGLSARCRVVCVGSSVVGYNALAVGAVAREGAARAIRRNMPETVPVMILGRLAVDVRHAGHHIAKRLLHDALVRTALVAEHAGCRACVVHALDQEVADRFYKPFGFRPFPTSDLTLFLPVETILEMLK